MTDTSVLSIDLDAVRSNLRVLRSVLRPSDGARPASGTGVCAVLKADGYGVGAAELARTLEHAGVEMLAVYTPREARAVLAATARTPVLMLMPVRASEELAELLASDDRARLRLTVHGEAQARSVASLVRDGEQPLAVHLEVDTGMSRGGASLAEATSLVRTIVRDARLRLTGVFSHFASADADAEQTERQCRAFDAWLDDAHAALPPGCVVHQANTFGAFRASRHHRGLVRVGLGLLGYAAEEFDNPGDFEHRALAEQLRPAIRWDSAVIHESRLAPGATAGYGGAWTATRSTRLGLVPVGYADGYPLSLSNRGTVRVREGQRWHAAPVVGRVSMDQITVDLTDLPEHIGVGSQVEILSDDRGSPCFLPAVAHVAGSITHDLLCRLSPRVERRYLHRDRAPMRDDAQAVALTTIPRGVRPIAVAE